MLHENDYLIEELCKTNADFKKLFDEHIRYEQDLEAMYSLKFFPPEVEQKIKDIKLLKLRGKDLMNKIITLYKSNKKI